MLPDIQKSKPEIHMYINSVGVDQVKVPVKIHEKGDEIHETVATVCMTCDLEGNIKGISMSRFIRTLNDFLDRRLNKDLIYSILKEFIKKNNSKTSSIKFAFDLPTIKKSVVSDFGFPEYYSCEFIGYIGYNYGIPNTFRFFQSVTVPYSSYCPCSAELCKDLENKGSSGFPHAQRSKAKVLVETDIDKIVWLEDLIQLVEESVVNIPYPIVKRVDEQKIAETARKNTFFVEDAVRKITHKIDSQDGIIDWIIRCYHEESIHTSRAIASMWKKDCNSIIALL